MKLRLVRCAILAVGICSLAAPNFAADQPPVATVNWDNLNSEKHLKSGELIPGPAGSPGWLKITNTEPGMRSLELCEIKSPPITSHSYLVRGRMRYENVVGVGYLEMWNHFGDQKYFTRTMGTDGPMQTVTGTSRERDFILPFHAGRHESPPSRLVINLVLNGPGTVEIGPLELVVLDSMAGWNATTGWWNGSTGGLIGGIGGSLLGIVGALVGTLVGLGRAKRLVLTLAALIAAVGVIALTMGLVALVMRQPYEVYYVLLLLGGMSTMAGFVILISAPVQFRARELRRMQAMDT